METAATQRTLLDEWQCRLDLLSRRQGDAAPFAKERARVLNFLIQRYRKSPEAQRPAPPRPKLDFQVNQRAIVVLHHIWEGRVGGVKSPQEAQTRVSTILKRISSPASIDAPENTAPDVFASDSPGADTVVNALASSNNSEQITSHPTKNARRAAGPTRRPFHPESAALDLYKRIVSPGVDDVQAAESLIQDRNRDAIHYALYAWRELAEAGRTNQAWCVLHRFLATPEPTGVVLEGVRESLAHGSAQVRIAALDILRRIGALEDISLLDDLLALPPTADEHPAERATLLHAMRSIAEATR